MFYGNPKSINDIPNITCYGCDFRREFLTMWNCVNRQNLWDSIKEINSVMFTNKIDHILSSKVIEANGKSVSGCGHSGATEAYCFQLVKYVANNGWESFVKHIQS